ncbi:Cell adhesion molecule 2 [Holothuria leucospilota]|uniref:Cell adhesion molecule 2 n=1 Tax=Holothuria leucospilota TaxID=206669 RepID=A0A9Q1H4K6_HOLLE|nr:Cell adhesion molecule 2 [Holothuria leucospilota]
MRMDIFDGGNFPMLVVIFLVVGGTGGTDSSARQELALLGKSISLECRLEPLVVILVWKKGFERIFHHNYPLTDPPILKTRANKTSEIDRYQRKVTLTINDLQYNDSGQYFCTQFQESGGKIISVFNLLVYGYPQLSVEPIIIQQNGTLNSTCCVTASNSTNETTISWLLGRKSLLPVNMTTYREMKNGLVKYCSSGLEILANRYIHGETLTCFVGNKNISASKVVDVLYSSTVKVSTKPSLTIYNNDKDVFISCEANGNPQPQLLLQKKDENGEWNDLEIKPMKSIEDNNITLTFYFGNASDDIKGMYRCIAFNDVGVAAVSKTVEVEY